MGVLEARYKAEKIGYPVVGEEVKDASNVIDYMIRSEQTKDISAEINANNQTTTGMANVIPGVNAPKLLEKTSIISEKPYMPSISYTTSFNYTNDGGWQKYTPITISGGDAYGDGSSGTITIPVKGTYMISFTGYDQQDGLSPSTGYIMNYAIYKNGTSIASTTVAFRTRGYINGTFELNKGDVIEFYTKWSEFGYIMVYGYGTISRVA